MASSPASAARIVPGESDILCEGCGYTLNGLPETGRCPECGKPIAESAAAGRHPTAWDRNAGRMLRAFIETSLEVIFHPTRFYRTLATRAPVAPARGFAHVYWLLSALLFSAAGAVHIRWYFSLIGGGGFAGILSRWGILLVVPALFVLTYAFLLGTTLLAARLTTWEAAYRGIRLPLSVVQRGMFYHAAHYLPVAVVTLATVLGYALATQAGRLDAATATTYLYVLSAEVIVAAAYLFNTYWIGMRNMMYANG